MPEVGTPPGLCVSCVSATVPQAAGMVGIATLGRPTTPRVRLETGRIRRTGQSDDQPYQNFSVL